MSELLTPFPGRRRGGRKELPQSLQVMEAEQSTIRPADPLTCSLCGRTFENRRGMHFHTRRCRG
jgi:hypothetical protein